MQKTSHTRKTNYKKQENISSRNVSPFLNANKDYQIRNGNAGISNARTIRY
jgi:hypothetical protein